MEVQNNSINVMVQDNGMGPNKENIFGNGLKNMRKRMEEINGKFIIEKNNGTFIKLSVPIKITQNALSYTEHWN